MTLLETVEHHLKESMKSGDSIKSETLKMLKSDLMYEKAKTGKDLTDEKMLEVTSRAAKRRKEAIEEFRKGGREDLASKEERELVIIEAYLPAQMTEADIESFIDAKLKSLGQISSKDFGKVMGDIMKELKGKADGGAVRSILNKKLESR